MYSMNYQLKSLYEINNKLQNSEYKKENLETALDELYQTFEGYFGIKSEMEEWNIDENGLVIPHSTSEKENFYYEMQRKIYQMLIEKEYTKINDLETKYEKGRRVGYRSALYDIKEKINEMI